MAFILNKFITEFLRKSIFASYQVGVFAKLPFMMSQLITFWQSLPSHMDPVIFSIGSFRLQYYGLMYILAFLTTYYLSTYRCRHELRFAGYSDEFHKDIMTAAFIGVLLGGRFGYVLFYHLGYYLQNPLEVILPIRFDPIRFVGISGMSYHGGLIGVFVATILFCRRHQESFWNLADLYGPIIPLGYSFGRIGNFINGELYGRVTSSSIGMIFPTDPEGLLRHPSQLYESFFEGVGCFLIMWFLRKKKLPVGSMAGMYLLCYGSVRFFIEFFREPDAHLGFVFLNFFSMGQMLCFAMITVGAGILLYRYRKGEYYTEPV